MSSNSLLNEAANELLYSPEAEALHHFHSQIGEEDSIDINESQNESPEPIAITDGFPPVQTAVVHHTHEVPDYPATHPNGYTYVINYEGKPSETVEQVHKEMQFQYAKHLIHPPRSVHTSFLQAQIIKYRLRCGGVMACEHLDDGVREFHHQEVNESTWDQLQLLRHTASFLNPGPTQKATTSLYNSIRKMFKLGNACQIQGADCRPKWCYQSAPDSDTNRICYPEVCCALYDAGDPGHFRKVITPTATVDQAFLQYLIENEPGQQEKCGGVYSTSTRRRDCYIGHPQGRGQLRKMSCDVVFTIMIPKDPALHKFATLTSHGVHAHPPPPPTKTPIAIMDAVVKLVHQANNPGLTSNSFLKSPLLKDFCEKHSAQAPSQMQSSFANLDPFSAIIQKENLLHFPKGRDFSGIVFEQYRDSRSRLPYVQRVFCDDSGIMVICCFKQQLEVLHTLESVVVDMSFKRVHDQNLTEVVFAAMLADNGGKFTTLLRVFVDQETTQMYYHIFHRVAALTRELTGYNLQFRYLHGSGLNAIVSDMDSNLIAGLGYFLHDIDEIHRPWSWQLLNIIIFCRIYFMQGVDKVAGDQSSETELRQRMQSLLTCASHEEYNDICIQIIANEEPHVAGWATHKANQVIAAGLNKNCSLIPTDVHEKVRSRIDAVQETCLNDTLVWGRYGSFLGAVMGSRKLDEQAIDPCSARLYSVGYYHNRQDDTMGCHHQDENPRKRQRVGPALQTEQEVLPVSSSSGNVQRLEAPNSRPSDIFTPGRQSLPRSSLIQGSTHMTSGPPASGISTQQRMTSVESREAQLQTRGKELRRQFLETKHRQLGLEEELIKIKKMELANEKELLGLEIARSSGRCLP